MLTALQAGTLVFWLVFEVYGLLEYNSILHILSRIGSRKCFTTEYDAVKLESGEEGDERADKDHDSNDDIYKDSTGNGQNGINTNGMGAGQKDDRAATQPFHKFERTTAHAVFLAGTAFGLIIIYMYLCEIAEIWPSGERTYNRDQFIFLVFVIGIVAVLTAKRDRKDIILNRAQTEEWKGWMQILFVFYHYFRAAETYNFIRVFIAAYVFMTGFGNFSYFWVREDYSVRRMIKSLFRLNFMVIFVCIATENEYMLYYICPMHTFWYLYVHAFFAIKSSWNKNSKLMAVKFVLALLFVVVIWESPGLVEVLFYPLKPILGFQDSMHEWAFRSGLDRYAPWFGMLCAYNYPQYEAMLRGWEKPDNPLGKVYKMISVVVCVIAFLIWLFVIERRDKFDYNSLHPYTSWIPLVVYIHLRNVSQEARYYHSALLRWLGRITLETYLGQLHIYMQANAKELIVYIPDYPLMNFVLNSAIYIYLSYRAFQATNTISNYIFHPDNDMKFILTHLGVPIACLFAALPLGTILLNLGT
eukprot:Clim_evm27s253 gene=Clim_evmTU27s253